MPIGMKARQHLKHLRAPLPSLTTSEHQILHTDGSNAVDGGLTIRTWSGGPVNDQICTGELLLDDEQCEWLARGLIAHLQHHWESVGSCREDVNRISALTIFADRAVSAGVEELISRTRPTEIPWED